MSYTKTYTQGNTRIVEGFEVPVRLPDKPELSAFRNYGLPQNEQKFRIDHVPPGIDKWKKKDIDTFVAERWHKRENGEWWLINNIEVYVPGYAWFFFNSWTPEAGDRPRFRMEAIDFFQVADHIIMDDTSYGALIIKCRRLGDTEKTLCLGYDITTRYRNSWFGMQNIIDTDAKENYERILVAHNNMEPWFKPRHKGSDDPAKGIRFQYGGRSESERGDFDIETSDVKPLMSRIDYRATVYRAYDGKRIRFYHLDEYGKILAKSMPVEKQWGVIKECLGLNNGKRIVGKAWFTTTVEEMNDGETVKVCRSLWASSNPAIRQANGRTTSGLLRYYRNFRLGAEEDEFGFHKVKEAEIARESQIKAYEDEKKFKDASDYKRKYPDTIKDALSMPSKDCIMYPALLDIQTAKVDSANKGKIVEDFIQAERYSLQWLGKPLRSGVRAVPNPNGRFYISQHPVAPNKFAITSEHIGPGNAGIYTGGIDGYDHKTGVSDGGFAIYMPLNQLYETTNDWIQTETGIFVPRNKGLMKTGRFVLTYRDRPENPAEFYMDCAMALFYYGAKALPESDKPGVIRWFEQYEIQEYLSFKPRALKVGAVNDKERGAKASSAFIGTWQPLLQSHVHDFWETYTHENAIDDLRMFTGSNRTECDLVIAMGHALALGHVVEVGVERMKQSNNRWNKIPA